VLRTVPGIGFALGHASMNLLLLLNHRAPILLKISLLLGI
jgi:hypothetical protein